MKKSALAFSFPRLQHGAASLAIVMLLVFILAAAVMAVMRISGSSVTDTAMNEAQTSALSLAESGLERAQATLTLAGYTSAACTDLKDKTFDLGSRGSFKYADAVFSANICTVTVTGTIGDSSRTIRAALSNTPAQGAAGNGSTIPLRLTTGAADVAIITNLAYPAGATAADIGSCTNTYPGSDPDACSDVLQVTGTGASKLSNRSVYESVAASGVYAITQTLENAGNPAPRNYVQVGAVFSPTSGTVGHVGAYAKANGTSGTGGTGGSIDANWNCAPGSGTGGAGGTANTLVYGFSALPTGTNRLDAVCIRGTFVGGVCNGIKMAPKRDLSGGANLGNLYSQIWVASNPAYSGLGTSGAEVTGKAPGKGTMTAKPSGDKLCISSDSVSNYEGNEHISGSYIASDTWLVEKPQSSGQAWCECNGGEWESMMGGGMGCKDKSMSTYGKGCRLNKSQSSSSSATVTVADKLFIVTAASKPYLEAGDTIFGAGVKPNTTIVKQITPLEFGEETGGKGRYEISPPQVFVSTNITSNGMTIETTSSVDAPVGTYIGIASGSGKFKLGTITKVKSIVNTLSSSTTAFKIYDRPETRLSGAQVCGGVCGILNQDGSSTPTPFTLNNITSNDDWSSGFTCLSNVSAALGTGEVIDSQRSQWSEVVQ